MKRDTRFVDIDTGEFIYAGPHIQIANPIGKTPRSVCVKNSDYDVIDLTKVDDSFLPRTNYTPAISIKDFREYINGFPIGKDDNGSTIYDCWMDYYRVGFREFVGSTSERTLICAILPKNCSHIYTIDSVAFKDYDKLLELCALGSSLPLDFYVKTMGINHVSPGRIQNLPMGIEDKYKAALYARILRLNSVNKYYSELWENCWTEKMSHETWSIDDERLSPFSLEEKWEYSSALRNSFERRMALVEIDVLCAMALGLSLDDIELMYNIQFPVLSDYEDNTWYDMNGTVVFTNSKGLIGVGVEKNTWESIRDQKEGETYTHTIDPAKSELYGGQQVTYYAPYTKCDRIEDYRRAWAHFEKVFKDKQ